MKLVKSLLLASVAGLSTVAVAQAADLPSRKAAPVEYVKVCNAYGAGFFYIPGTDTCLKVGGLVSFDARAFAPLQRSAGGASVAGRFARVKAARDLYGTTTVGRVELDARTQTAWGTLRTFVRVDGVYSTASSPAAGSLPLYGQSNGNAAPTAAKDVTYINKAFIQFAGITAGRAQSMFDFYADAYNNELLRGSNATTNLLAYTATFGGGFSATLSLEDETARRAAVGGLAGIGSGAGLYADVGGTRVPDVVAALRVDQAWGSAQLSAALHKVSGINGALSAAGANNIIVPDTVVGTDSNFGYAVQGGVKINLPSLAAGDALYLQAAYAKGAVGYTNGTNLAFFQGFNNQRNYDIGGLNALNSGPNMATLPLDCVFTAANKCELGKSWSLTAAFKHFWTPTISQSIFGSYFVHSQARLAESGVAPRYKEWRVGTNVFWTPVKGFDIGAEVMYQNGAWDKFGGAAIPATAFAPAIPVGGKVKADVTEYRVIVRRAF